jgi:transcriptional regulator with XRE-family HTH domain
VLIGDCIRVTREAKKMSQGDIEKRTDLNRCYISRVKNGHTVPSLETLEKFATRLRGSPSISLSMPRRAFQYWQAL